ncbi:MAG: cyclic nucleotide-binding domain-containing protein [Christensenella sp.]|nr:cyclic nucleotide-binding domain-containing protein [Christensenella sp.]
MRAVAVLCDTDIQLAGGQIRGPVRDGIRIAAGDWKQGEPIRFLIDLIVVAIFPVLAAGAMVQSRKMVQRSFLFVLAAVLALSLAALLFAGKEDRLVCWLVVLLFLLTAVPSVLSIIITNSDLHETRAGLAPLLFLAAAGILAALNQPPRNLSAGGIVWYAVLLASFALMLAYSAVKRRRMTLLRAALRDTAKTGDLKLALGEEGIRQLMPYFSEKMRTGSSVAKLLILDLLRTAEFDGKDALVRDAFDAGPLEVRLSIIDQIFDWSLPYRTLLYCVEQCDAALAEYLTTNLFLNDSDIAAHGMLDEVRARSGRLRGFLPSGESARMFSYTIDGRREEYGVILEERFRSGRKEDRLYAARIMAAFIGREDEANRTYLAEVIEKTLLNPAEAEEMIELCAQYDTGLDYLKRFFSGYYAFPFLQRICAFYEPVSVVKSFEDSGYSVPLALTLLAACRLGRGSVAVYRKKLDRLIDTLRLLAREESKIHLAGLDITNLLLDEIASLKRTLATAATAFLLLDETGSRTDSPETDVNNLLASGDPERCQTGISTESAERLRCAFTATASVNDGFDYGVLRVSANGTLLESIYRYLGGEKMESMLTENIEKLIALKAIPMFKELDVFTLQQIQKIAVYQKLPAGETVIAEGEEGESLFVIIRGKVGVYKAGAAVNEIGAGGLFGEMAVIEKQKRSATIRTLEETDFLVIAGEDFATLLERNSSVSGAVIRTLAERLRKMLEER